MGQLHLNEGKKESTKIIRLVSDANPKIVGDDQLLHSLFQSDPRRGCEALFRKYYANLCNHAIRFVYAKDVAEEIVAEVFANFWQAQVYEQIHSSYHAYLYKAVRNRAYNYLRFELNRTVFSDFPDDKLSTPILKPDEVLHYQELCRKVDSIIRQLPPQCRKAFQMNRLEGKKYAEVATELQITVSAVERLISRALARLRTELREDWLISFLLIVGPLLV